MFQLTIQSGVKLSYTNLATNLHKLRAILILFSSKPERPCTGHFYPCPIFGSILNRVMVITEVQVLRVSLELILCLMVWVLRP